MKAELGKLDADFKTVSGVIFGSGIGGLEEFGPWLRETMFSYREMKSSISGKEVVISSPYYTKNARFVSQDEIAGLKFEPLDVNDIKDMDSLLEAVQDRMAYCGNKLFGKNTGVERVDNCVDCAWIYDSHNLYRVKYAAHCSMNRESEHTYGVSAFPKSSYCIRCVEGVGAARCFETYYATNVMDALYCLNVSGCSNCMFSFNLKSRHHMIGNLQLSRERYLELRKKLVSEMAEILRKEKRIFSIAEIVRGGKSPEEVPAEPSLVPPTVEKAFADTARVVLGKEHEIERLAPGCCAGCWR